MVFISSTIVLSDNVSLNIDTLPSNRVSLIVQSLIEPPHNRVLTVPVIRQNSEVHYNSTYDQEFSYINNFQKDKYDRYLLSQGCKFKLKVRIKGSRPPSTTGFGFILLQSSISVIKWEQIGSGSSYNNDSSGWGINGNENGWATPAVKCIKCNELNLFLKVPNNLHGDIPLNVIDASWFSSGGAICI